MTNKTEEIFKTTAPYSNPYQGDYSRWLFVCSAGLLRSPTGATLASKVGINARSCGSTDYALIPISANLLAWADLVIFVNPENYEAARKKFEPDEFCSKLLQEKTVVLNIPDKFEYMEKGLQQAFFEQLPQLKPSE